MKIVIDIPEETYKKFMMSDDSSPFMKASIKKVLNTGKKLPEHHGRLIDADALITKVEDLGICNGVSEGAIDNAQTIIEADKEADEG